MKIFNLCLFVVALGLVSCDESRVYETNKNIPEDGWLAADSVVFDFQVPDSTQEYNFYYNVRYSGNYPYYNLYVKHFLYDSTGNKLEADLMNMDLFDSKTGKPLGDGMGDVYDRRILFLQDQNFPYQGQYTLKALHYMRDTPLKGIQSFGLRVEKDQKNKD